MEGWRSNPAKQADFGTSLNRYAPAAGASQGGALLATPITTTHLTKLMRLLKNLLLVGAMSLALAAVAQAQTKVYITGSTAFRGPTHNAIKNILGAGVTYGFTGTSFTGASQAIFEGSVNGSPVIVKTSWSGSVAGIQTVSNGLPISNFLTDATPRSTGGTGSATTNNESAVPDIAMADNYQNVTPFNATTLVDVPVGVVPFKWVANAGAPAALSNITPQLAQALFLNGSLSLALFTNSSADEGLKVFAVGRDPDSGTRVTTFAESGIGVNTQVVQYQPTVSGTKVTSQIPWPQSTVNGITFPEGDGGFSSGGQLVNVMNKTTFADLNGYYISYMGLGDATNAIGQGAKELSYNGVLYSDAAVKQGTYTFWGYEHLMYKSTLAVDKKAVATALATQIDTVDSPVLRSQMRVQRLSDGGLVTPTF
jgi:hypothetical protein